MNIILIVFAVILGLIIIAALTSKKLRSGFKKTFFLPLKRIKLARADKKEEAKSAAKAEEIKEEKTQMEDGKDELPGGLTLYGYGDQDDETDNKNDSFEYDLPDYDPDSDFTVDDELSEFIMRDPYSMSDDYQLSSSQKEALKENFNDLYEKYAEEEDFGVDDISTNKYSTPHTEHSDFDDIFDQNGDGNSLTAEDVMNRAYLFRNECRTIRDMFDELPKEMKVLMVAEVLKRRDDLDDM